MPSKYTEIDAYIAITNTFYSDMKNVKLSASKNIASTPSFGGVFSKYLTNHDHNKTFTQKTA